MVQGNKIRTVLFHIAVCFVFLMYPYLFSPARQGEPFLTITGPFIRDLIANVLLLLFGYLNYYFLVPALYFKKSSILYLYYFAYWLSALCLHC